MEIRKCFVIRDERQVILVPFLKEILISKYKNFGNVRISLAILGALPFFILLICKTLRKKARIFLDIKYKYMILFSFIGRILTTKYARRSY